MEKVLQEHKIEPSRLWNVDESGFSTVPYKHSKIYATKGCKQVGILTSAERGQHLTVVCYMSAMGNFIPPDMIFLRKNMKNELMDDAPTGSVGFLNETGWMTGDIFIKWPKHFVKPTKPTKEDKVLLFLDGHGTHKGLEVLSYSKGNGIILFCFPAHYTHRVQPLDVTFYSPLTTYYNKELNTWLKNHPGRTVTHYQVAGIFQEAYLRTATVSTAVSGFVKTGIHHFSEMDVLSCRTN